MTVQQNNAIWEMWRQGLHQLASLAEQRWEHGERVEPNDTLQAPRIIWAMVEQANRQIRHGPR